MRHLGCCLGCLLLFVLALAAVVVWQVVGAVAVILLLGVSGALGTVTTRRRRR
jgi:UPF0716 family protein affecting phage T7 exclusion